MVLSKLREQYHTWLNSINPNAKIETQYCRYTKFGKYVEQLENDKEELLQFVEKIKNDKTNKFYLYADALYWKFK